jgi:hypothetical protein
MHTTDNREGTACYLPAFFVKVQQRVSCVFFFFSLSRLLFAAADHLDAPCFAFWFAFALRVSDLVGRGNESSTHTLTQPN